MYYAVRPMLAVSHGRLVAMTTPFGRRGFFYKEWSGGGPGWHRIKVTAEECPRISDAFLEEERRSMPEWRFRQEYMCQFVDTDETFFPTELVERAFTPEVVPLFDGPIAWRSAR